MQKDMDVEAMEELQDEIKEQAEKQQELDDVFIKHGQETMKDLEKNQMRQFALTKKEQNILGSESILADFDIWEKLKLRNFDKEIVHCNIRYCKKRLIW